MKRSTIKWILGLTTAASAIAMLAFWSQIAEAFGPLEQSESQCLICHRERITKWVCGSKVRDDIGTNQYSDWIDTFTPVNHQHVWTGHTGYYRRYWFGRTSIGCGGIATIPRIFEQRTSLGEAKSRQLAARFHQLVRGQSPQVDFGELDRFTKTVVDDPGSLLKTKSPD